MSILAFSPTARSRSRTYGNGCGPVYFGAGYVSQGEWWRNGFVICTMNVVIWLTIGMAWWKVIGLY